MLKTEADLIKATLKDMVATFAELTGQKEEAIKFKNKEEAAQKVKMAMLSSKSAREKLGLKEGEVAQVTSMAEMKKIAKKTGRELPEGYMSEFAPAEKPLREKLKEKADAAPAPDAEKAPRKPRGEKVEWVKAVDGGTSKVREDSQRGQVLAAIRAAKGGIVNVTELTEAMGFDTSGYVGKLLEKAHLVVIEAPKGR